MMPSATKLTLVPICDMSYHLKKKSYMNFIISLLKEQDFSVMYQLIFLVFFISKL